MGTSTEGAVLLSRHGATYSAAASEVCAYPELLERMLGVVLPSFPANLRERARPALISRWNRDWGVEAEDLVRRPAANDNGSGFATASVEASTSPFAPSQPRIEGDGSLPPRAALAVSSDPPLRTDDERVDEAGWGSFPASDPPPWTSGRERHPHPHQDDPDGGDNRERARRRRHLD